MQGVWGIACHIHCTCTVCTVHVPSFVTLWPSLHVHEHEQVLLHVLVHVYVHVHVCINVHVRVHLWVYVYTCNYMYAVYFHGNVCRW